MKVVITGAAGFLGRKLTRRLLDGAELVDRDGRSGPVDALVLFDVVPAPSSRAATFTPSP